MNSLAQGEGLGFFAELNHIMPWAHKKEVEGDIQKMGPTASLRDPKEWKKVYPAGCPRRKLVTYLQQQLQVNEQDAETITKFIDTDDSGTFEWSELNTALIDLKPSLENHTIAMTRFQTAALKREQMDLQETLAQVQLMLRETGREEMHKSQINMKSEISELTKSIEHLTSMTEKLAR